MFSACCSDIGYLCWIWKTTGKCVRSSDYAVNKCKKTCNFCPVPTGKLLSTRETEKTKQNKTKKTLKSSIFTWKGRIFFMITEKCNDSHLWL